MPVADEAHDSERPDAQEAELPPNLPAQSVVLLVLAPAPAPAPREAACFGAATARRLHVHRCPSAPVAAHARVGWWCSATGRGAAHRDAVSSYAASLARSRCSRSSLPALRSAADG